METFLNIVAKDIYTKIGNDLWERVGYEPSGNSFNSLVQLENENGIPKKQKEAWLASFSGLFHYLCQQFFTNLAQFSLSVSPDSIRRRCCVPPRRSIR